MRRADPTANESYTIGLGPVRNGLEAAYRRIFEVRIPLSAVKVNVGQPVRFQLSVWQSGLPMDALPPQGWIEFSTADPLDWVL